MINITSVGGTFFFTETASAGSATFDLTDGNDLQASMNFEDDSTAGNATINASAGSVIIFYDSSNGGAATLNLSTTAFALFEGSNNAEQMIGNCIGGDEEYASQIDFEGSSSAGEGTFTTIGGSTSGEHGGYILFDGTATADNATFVINGGMGAGLSGTELFFTDTTTAANASITANGGIGGSKGGVIYFQKTSTGGTASITLTGNAKLDLSTHKAPGVTIGSLAGKGSALLGANTLSIGSNNQSTTFSGVTQGTGGVSKTGTGTLTVSGNNTYTGPTVVGAGVFVANNKRGSATGSGSVNVQAGTLGGQGALSGPVTIGTGSGKGAFLAPSAAAKQPVTLSLTNTLTFNSDATYTCALQASKKKSANDEVVANGVTIASGAQFNLVAKVQGKLKPGMSFAVISNTASTPISGTFANLADGAIITVGNTKLQASYEGGDGNDLTLTVVP
jgi:autotransporter-associated beta strand protein